MYWHESLPEYDHLIIATALFNACILLIESHSLLSLSLSLSFFVFVFFFFVTPKFSGMLRH
jgi:hypothetical protein